MKHYMAWFWKEFRFVSLWFCLVICTGCGKQLKVSIRPSESQKDSHTAALTRRVEVSYHDAEGSEVARESVPVIGLGQPVQIRKDSFERLKVEEGGYFSARAYSADSVPILQGMALVDANNKDNIEVLLDTTESLDDSPLGSALLRRVRLEGVPSLQSFEVTNQELAQAQSENRCIDLPEVEVNGQSGSARLVFETTILGAHLKYSMVIGDERVERPALLNVNGFPTIELGRDFLEGLLLTSSHDLELRLESSTNEGCFKIHTRLRYQPLEIQETVGEGQMPSALYYSNAPLIVYRIHNPNGFPIRLNIDSTARRAGGLEPCFAFSDNPMHLLTGGEGFKCAPLFEDSRVIPALGNLSFGFYSRAGYDRSHIVLETNFRPNFEARTIGAGPLPIFRRTIIQ